jgi:hypothetical protein
MRAAAGIGFLSSNIRVPMRILGAKLGANDHSYRATPGHIQPLRLQLSGTSGDIQHYQATL